MLVMQVPLTVMGVEAIESPEQVWSWLSYQLQLVDVAPLDSYVLPPLELPPLELPPLEMPVHTLWLLQYPVAPVSQRELFALCTAVEK